LIGRIFLPVEISIRILFLGEFAEDFLWRLKEKQVHAGVSRPDRLSERWRTYSPYCSYESEWFLSDRRGLPTETKIDKDLNIKHIDDNQSLAFPIAHRRLITKNNQSGYRRNWPSPTWPSGTSGVPAHTELRILIIERL